MAAVVSVSPQGDGTLQGGRQVFGFSQDIQNARHRGQGIERRLSRGRRPVPTGGSPEGLERGGIKGVLLRQFFGFTESGRDHGVDRMLLDGPGGHLGDHTGADDRLRSAVCGPRQPTGQPSAMPCRGDRGCPAERQRPHGRADLLPSVACNSPVARKRRTAAWVVGPAPRIVGSALASRPRKARSSTCPLASARYSATSSSCAVSSDVAPRGQSPRAGSASSASQRTSSGVLTSQGTPSASPAA